MTAEGAAVTSERRRLGCVTAGIDECIGTRSSTWKATSTTPFPGCPRLDPRPGGRRPPAGLAHAPALAGLCGLPLSLVAAVLAVVLTVRAREEGRSPAPTQGSKPD
ncbi:MAG: hypothetical protein INH41_16170 [Myxococcaceae bacterium]|nr:hypothetical protein [Myxococcaceae bacterium]